MGHLSRGKEVWNLSAHSVSGTVFEDKSFCFNSVSAPVLNLISLQGARYNYLSPTSTKVVHALCDKEASV